MMGLNKFCLNPPKADCFYPIFLPRETLFSVSLGPVFQHSIIPLVRRVCGVDERHP